MSLSPSRCLFALVIFSAVPLLVACPEKKTPPPFDAGAPPVVEDVQTVLTPLEEDAGADADADADAGKKFTGPAVNTNVARLKQCCNALSGEAKRMGSSPEAGMFTAAAQQCSAMAAQAGPTGTAPEMGMLRGLLAGRTIPAACAGF
jgi:hypothetical protein